MKRVFLLLSVALVTSACQQMGPTEVAVRFRKVPPIALGPIKVGGVSKSIVAPGELAVVMPWDALYKFDTSLKDISWPSGAAHDAKNTDTGSGLVNTRALDGNEVALAVTVRYRVKPEAETLVHLVQDVATNDEEVRDLVVSVARADIRTYMNHLRTAAFLNETSRYAAVDAVRGSMAKRLEPMGIEVPQVILNDFRFERLLKDGSVDDSYQEKITEIQKLGQDTERERSRIETVKAKKQQELSTAQAGFNRIVAEAEGYKKQGLLRGDSYYQAKQNEAKGLLALGTAEAKGLTNQIEALSGPGARAIIKLELARQLLKGNPKFVVLNQGRQEQGLSLQRTDTNQLLTQMGLIEALQERGSAGLRQPNASGEVKPETQPTTPPTE